MIRTKNKNNEHRQPTIKGMKYREQDFFIVFFLVLFNLPNTNLLIISLIPRKALTLRIYNDVPWLVESLPDEQRTHAAVKLRHLYTLRPSVRPVKLIGVPVNSYSSR